MRFSRVYIIFMGNALFIIFLYLLIRAFQGNGALHVHFNLFGEMMIESIVFIILFTLNLLFSIRELRGEEK